MGLLLMGLAGLTVLAALGCTLLIIYDAFQDELWKGLLALLIPIYLLYYAVFEFDHERKWPIVLGSLFGAGLGGMFLTAALALMRHH